MAQRPRVLVIEDDAAISDMVKGLLEHWGFEASSAATGTDGLAKARKEMPSAILLDVMLPGMDGFDVCKALKSDGKTKGIKIIMLTGLGKVSDVDKAFTLGADDYVIKPFKAAWLINKVQKALGLPTTSS